MDSIIIIIIIIIISHVINLMCFLLPAVLICLPTHFEAI
jgi:hypothetical protein